MLRLTGGLAHGQDRGCRSHGIGNPNESLLRNMTSPSASEREYARSHKCECQAKPISPLAMWIHPNQNGNGCAQGGNLRQGEVDKDDSTFDHMHAKISVYSGQDKTGHKRPDQKWQNLHVAPSPFTVSPGTLWSTKQYRNRKAENSWSLASHRRRKADKPPL